MKDLGKEDYQLVEQFTEPFVELLKDIISAKDVCSEVELSAWEDWSVDKLIEEFSLTKERALAIVVNIEEYYKLKVISYD